MMQAWQQLPGRTYEGGVLRLCLEYRPTDECFFGSDPEYLLERGHRSAC